MEENNLLSAFIEITKKAQEEHDNQKIEELQQLNEDLNIKY